jgi:transcriptional regulator with XRE-family HTH domain
MDLRPQPRSAAVHGTTPVNNMDEMNDLNEVDAFRMRLRKAIRRKGITQTVLARELGVRDATVSDWFNRGTVPNGAILLRVPDILDVDGHWLLTGEGDPKRVPAEERSELAKLADAERMQIATLLQVVMKVVEGKGSRTASAAPEEEDYIRVRGATEDESAALESIQAHGEQKRRRGRPRKQQEG